MSPINVSPYSLFVLCGIVLSLLYWGKAAKKDQWLIVVYFSALGGAFVGAKLAFILAEAWVYSGEEAWRQWLVGKSITGALLGGLLGVELGKKLVGYTKSTGDRFALIIPWGVMLGRVGCLYHGCCLGKTFDGWHWPAPLAEIVANFLIWLGLFAIRRKPWAKDQLFYLYLMLYGAFRFLHEFLRDTPKIINMFSGYQVIALLLLVVGALLFIRKK